MGQNTFREYLENKKNDESLTWSERTAFNECYETWSGTDDHRVIDTIDELKNEITYLQGQVSNFEWALECADFTDQQIDLIRMGYFNKVNFEEKFEIINEQNLFEDTADGIANFLDEEYFADDIPDDEKEDLLNHLYEAQSEWICSYAERMK